jgi:Beta-lactamase
MLCGSTAHRLTGGNCFAASMPPLQKGNLGELHSCRAVFALCLSLALGMAAFRTVAAESPAPLELSATNLASVLDPLMAEWIDKHKGPGAVVVVVKRDGEVFAKGYGFSDIEAGKPFTADATLVRPGSISKLFTGIAVMQLVEAGRLGLDRDVNGYIDFIVPVPEGGVPVTLRRRFRGALERAMDSQTRTPRPLACKKPASTPLSERRCRGLGVVNK